MTDYSWLTPWLTEGAATKNYQKCLPDATKFDRMANTLTRDLHSYGLLMAYALRFCSLKLKGCLQLWIVLRMHL